MTVRKLLFISAILSSSIGFSSCSKDKDQVSGLDGNWKFDHIQAITVSDNTVNYDGEIDRLVTKTDYISVDNGGEMTISGNNISYTNLTYRVTDTAFVDQYYAGIYSGTDASTVEYTMPATSMTGTLQHVGQDSLVFSGGGAPVMNPSTAHSDGARYKIEGNTLTIYSKASGTSDTDYGGYPMHTYEYIDYSMVFQRQ